MILNSKVIMAANPSVANVLTVKISLLNAFHHSTLLLEFCRKVSVVMPLYYYHLTQSREAASVTSSW